MPLIAQPATTTISELARLLRAGATSFDAAVAYATFTGTKLLLDNAGIAQLPKCKTRFLVGIDWFRSEPAALDVLQGVSNKNLRIIDAPYLLSTKTCQPRRTYHPKAYGVTGSTSALIIGSANLSRNGLQRSTELSIITDQSMEHTAFAAWFTAQWGTATPWEDIRSRYHSLYPAAKKREFVTTEDDDVEDTSVLKIKWVTAERLRLMRAAQNLWVDVGHLHNRGPNLPGTDLQFTKMTRVFFGHEARVVPGNTHLLDIQLTMPGAVRQTRPMVFNRSSDMDRLSLPVPNEGGWPAIYDDKTLLFSKNEDGSFEVRVARGTDRTLWQRQSATTGFIISMSQGRRDWGVF